MGIRKKDFQRIVVDVKEFLSKLTGSDTSELRDSLNFTLLHLHKYYKKLRHNTKNVPLLDGSFSLTSSLNTFTSASPYFPPVDKYDWHWINLDASKLSASFGHGDASNLLPEIFYMLKNGDHEKLEKFLQNNNDSVNEVDPLGRSTALYCIYGRTVDHVKCLHLLIKNGVDLQQEANDGMTCFHLAAIMDFVEVIDILVEKQIAVNVEDNEGRYPLHLAAAYSSERVVKKMLSAGADKNSLDNDEMTPIMWAAYFDRVENLQVLLGISHNGSDERKAEAISAELQDKDLNGRTILHMSVCKTTNKDCFKVLFSADYAHIVDDVGRNILHTIAEKGAIRVLDEYFDTCNVGHLESLDHKDRTPLHLACMNGHGEIVDALLSKGASLDVIDKHGMRPFDYAKVKNLNYCMLVMLSHEKYRHKTSGTNHPLMQNTQSVKLTNQSNQFTINNEKCNMTLDQKSSLIVVGAVGSKKENDVITNKNKDMGKLNQVEQSNENKDMGKLNQVEQSNENKDMGKLNQVEQSDENDDHKKESETTKLEQPRSRKQSFETHFDTPQEFEIQKNLNGKYLSPLGSSDENVLADQMLSGLMDDDISEDNEIDINLNDQLIVLVEHHGSEDEVVINMNDGELNDQSDDVFTDNDVHVDDDGEDQDLMDARPFARNGSITTVGVVSEGNMAFNSVTANPSISSLLSSGDESEEQRNTSRLSHDGRSKKTSSKSYNTSQNKKSLPKQRNLSGSPDASLSINNFTAPIPPPSHFYEDHHITSETLVINDSDAKYEPQYKKPQRNAGFKSAKEKKPRHRPPKLNHPENDQRSPPDQLSLQIPPNQKTRSPTRLSPPITISSLWQPGGGDKSLIRSTRRNSTNTNAGGQTLKLAPLLQLPRPPSQR